MSKILNLIRLLFLFIILFLICFNFRGQFRYWKNCLYRINTHHIDRVGSEFQGLSTYLQGVNEAGFMSCLHSSNPLTDVDVMGPYQQAQFVLSPTILDYFHPLDYSHIIFWCPQERALKGLPKQLSSYQVLEKSDGVLLLYRKQAAR